jgi:putative tryptophan/tyrosine transport system substrate-binding protein
MNRRELMLLLAGAMTAAPALRAQQPKLTRVGILTAEESERVPKFDAFREGLRDLGYVEGRNIILEFRLASGNLSLFSQLAAALVALPVDVIVTESQFEAVMAVSGHIPIVGPVVAGGGGHPLWVLTITPEAFDSEQPKRPSI